MRGQKTTKEIVYQVMASYATTGNFSQTARELNMPAATVRDIFNANCDKPEFTKLQAETKEAFADSATKIIEKGLALLERRFSRAILQEAELDALIEAVSKPGGEMFLTQAERSSLIAKLRGLQLQDVKSVTTAIGTLYDKRALAEGTATDNVAVTVKLPEGIDEYAG